MFRPILILNFLKRFMQPKHTVDSYKSYHIRRIVASALMNQCKGLVCRLPKLYIFK